MQGVIESVNTANNANRIVSFFDTRAQQVMLVAINASVNILNYLSPLTLNNLYLQTSQKSSTTLSGYLDGLLQGTLTDGNSYSNLNKFNIGKQSTGSVAYLTGHISENIIWNNSTQISNRAAIELNRSNYYGI